MRGRGWAGVLVLLLLSAARPSASQAPFAAAPTTRPTLERLELVTDRAVTGAGGNTWGGHQTRIVRTTRGVFTAYTVAGSGDTGRQWRLAERQPQGWRVIAQGPSGPEAVNLLADPQGGLRVIAWPDGLPRVWSIAESKGIITSRSAALPGPWVKTDYPYCGAGTDARGDLCIVGSTGEKPGQLRWAYRSAHDGSWKSEITSTDTRYCYSYVLPGANGNLTLVATQDVLWQDLGYAKPAGAFAYVFSGVTAWLSPQAVKEALQPTLVREEAPTPAFPFVQCSSAQGDAYTDTRGRLHVLYWLRGPSTKDYQRTRHAIIDRGRVVKDVELPVDTGHYSRIIQDATGRFYILSAGEGSSTLEVYPAVSEDGTALGPPIRLDLHGHRVTYFGLAVAAPRCGVPLADYVDGVFPSGAGASWVYFRVRLRGTPAAVTAPPR